MKRLTFSFFLLSFVIGCGAKPPEEVPVQQKVDAKPNFPEVGTTELETLGETFVGKKVVLKGVFFGIENAYMGTLFDKSLYFGFRIKDKKEDTFLIMLL